MPEKREIVFSSRLSNCRDPREARALQILEAWEEYGYSKREILTMALIALDGRVELPDTPGELADKLNEGLIHLDSIIDRLASTDALPVVRQQTVDEGLEVSAKMKAALAESQGRGRRAQR